jgi:hypothetical protein
LTNSLCPSCNSTVNAGAKFCDRCGEPLLAAGRPVPKKEDDWEPAFGDVDREMTEPLTSNGETRAESRPDRLNRASDVRPSPVATRIPESKTPSQNTRQSNVFSILRRLASIPISGLAIIILHSELRLRHPSPPEVLFAIVLLVLAAYLLFSRSGRASGKAVRGPRGTVRNFQSRTEGGGTRAFDKVQRAPTTVWTWRLASEDSEGNSLPVVPVEMKGKRFTGFVSEGDDVEITQSVRVQGVIVPSKVYNHSTNSWVVVSK